ncbi:MAG: 4Fe-4S dicluster domain-containing protein [Desulfobacterales bacterium]|jgi:heterodisulfide reductase subunit C
MPRETLYPNYELLEKFETAGPFLTAACFQCRKCTNGCPVTFAMDIYPDEVIRMVLLGQREAVLRCNTIWVCAACETCTTRCPNEVKIAELMDFLKEMAVQEGMTCPQPQILNLHETFLENVKKRGRVFESTFLAYYLLRGGKLRRKWNNGRWLDELKLGWQMLCRGRLPLFPRAITGKKEVRAILSHSKPVKSKP